MCQKIDVVRDNLVDLETISQYDKIVLSPGPGLPEETITLQYILNQFSGKIPILGICLGMQGIAQHIGGKLSPKKTILHGKPVELTVKNHNLLFHQIPSNFSVGLYHSWEVKIGDEHSKFITSLDMYYLWTIVAIFLGFVAFKSIFFPGSTSNIANIVMLILLLWILYYIYRYFF